MGEYIQGAFHQIIKAIQVYLQMLSSRFLVGIRRALWLLSAPRLWWICVEQTSPQAKCWPVLLQTLNKKQTKDWLSMTLLSLFGSIRLQLLLRRPHPPHGRGVELHFTLQEHYGLLSCIEASWKRPKKPLCSSRTPMEPPPLHLSPTPSLSQPLDIYAGENYYFSISRSSSQKGEERHVTPTWPIVLIYSWLSSYPPPLHSVSPLVVCIGWTADTTELVGKAENGLRSQNPVGSLIGRMAQLPAASVYQLRPIMCYIWPGLVWLGLL